MSKKQELVGPWRAIHGAVWLIGLAILAWQGWWWPGILVLVAVSTLVEALIQMLVPESTGPGSKSASMPPPDDQEIDPSQALNRSPVEFRADRLPAVCPQCNAPVNANEVKWRGAHAANCAYCSANLPLKTES